MCGRTRCTLSDADIVAAVKGTAPAAAGAAAAPATRTSPTSAITWPARSLYTPLHNAGPTRVTPVVTGVDDSGSTITVESMVWGAPRRGGGGGGPASLPLSSSSSTPPTSTSSAILVNGRAETAFATPTWAHALAAGRAGRGVVIANGYYEWKRTSGGTGCSSAPAQPHFIFRADGVPLALAALVVPPPPGAPEPALRRYAVLTTAPPKALAWLHDRAPVLLPTPAAVRAWLGGTVTPATLASLASPAAVGGWPALTAHPVTREMGNIKYQAADASADVRARKGSLGSLFARAGAAGASPPAAKRAKVEKEEVGGIGVVVSPPAQKKAKHKASGRTLDAWVKKEGAR